MYDELIKALHEGAEFLECSTPGIENSFAKMCHNAADAIEELLQETQQLPRWISVTERLPEERLPVLAICKNGVMFVAEYEWTNYDGAHWNTRGPLGSGRRIGKARVTHWMPLPQPPKEDEA